MRINKVFLSFFVLIFSWLMFISPQAEAAVNQNDPVALLRYIADNMIAGLKQNKATLKTKPEIVYGLARRYVVPYAALTAMSQRVLPPQVWNNATPAQRKQFEHEFTTTVIRTYASALNSYEDQEVQFYPVRGGTEGLKTVEVNSQITSSQSQPINVSYRLMRINNVWRLYDMSVEGISMLDSFREQFSDILGQGDMTQLLQRLAGHNKG